MRTVTVDHVLKYLLGTYTDQWYLPRKGQSTIAAGGVLPTLNANPATGQQDTPSLCPAHRAFFLFFIFIFWRDNFFFVKKTHFSKKKMSPYLYLLSLRTRTLGISWFHVFHQRKVTIMTETRCYIEVL